MHLTLGCRLTGQKTTLSGKGCIQGGLNRLYTELNYGSEVVKGNVLGSRCSLYGLQKQAIVGEPDTTFTNPSHPLGAFLSQSSTLHHPPMLILLFSLPSTPSLSMLLHPKHTRVPLVADAGQPKWNRHRAQLPPHSSSGSYLASPTIWYVSWLMWGNAQVSTQFCELARLCMNMCSSHILKFSGHFSVVQVTGLSASNRFIK